jgi:hypothetical protein
MQHSPGSNKIHYKWRGFCRYLENAALVDLGSKVLTVRKIRAMFVKAVSNQFDFHETGRSCSALYDTIDHFSSVYTSKG